MASTRPPQSAPRGGRRPFKGPPRPKPEGAATVPPSRSFSTSLPALAVPAPGEGATRFRDIPGLHADLLKAIPYEHCTDVQAATLPVILAGNDVLAQAKTGTGKTLGFLIPAIQHLFSSPYPAQGSTSIFIISPTRELAQQISTEAERILQQLGEGRFGVQTVVGGTNIKTDLKNLRERRADILVATPGRVIDLLENSPLGQRLSQLKTLVLDEADRLLDQGFRRELVKIIDALPKPTQVPRQTLLFSATIPNEVHTIASLALKKDHKFISTLSEDDTNVHEHVRQELALVPQEDVLPLTMAALLREAAKDPNFKVIVFLPTARAAALFHDVFDIVGAFPVWEIHSRLSQSKRTNTTEAFRQAQKGVLFSSDVTARGIDIKGITAVIQAGAPMNAEQYIHRLGRTARAGAEGHGVLILSDFESFFLKDKIMQSLTLHPFTLSSTSELDDLRSKINKAMDQVPEEAKSQAYGAWLGYYKAYLKSIRWSASDLVQAANYYSSVVLRYGSTPPGLLAKTVGKMGLKGTPGLRIVKELDSGAGGAGGARGGAGGGGRGGLGGGGGGRGGFGGGRPSGPPRPQQAQGGMGGFGGDNAQRQNGPGRSTPGNKKRPQGSAGGEGQRRPQRPFKSEV